MNKILEVSICVYIGFLSIALYFGFNIGVLLFFIICFVPFVTTFLLFFIPLNSIRFFMLFSVFLNFVMLSVFSYKNFDFNTYSIQFYYEFLIIPTFNISYSFGLDLLSLVFLFLTSFLTFICTLSVWYNTNRIRQNFIFMSFVQFLLFQVFSVLDLFFFFMFYEFVLFPMFILIGSWGGRSQKVYAAYLFFYYTFAGSVLMLFSVIYIHIVVGSTSYVALNAHNFTRVEQIVLFLGLFFSFASKLPIYPFHVWLPEAHVEAPTAASVFLAGILLKMGGYGLIRWCLTFFIDAAIFFSPIINTLCLVSIIYASFSALCQLDMKRIIAYSSIVHMSYSTIGIFSFNNIALTGSIFGMVTHGIISAGLFLSVGILYDRFGTRSILNYGGLVRFMPMFDTIFFVFSLSNMAFPGTGGFVSEFLTLLGVYKTFPLSVIFLLLGTFFTGVFSLWLYTRVFFGVSNSIFIPATQDENAYINQFTDLTFREFNFFFPLLVCNFSFGLFPAFITYQLDCWAISIFNL